MPIRTFGLWAARVAFVLACGLSLWGALTPGRNEAPGLFPWDKANHFVAFYVMSLVGAAAFPRASLLTIGLSLVGLGAGIEILQATPFVARDADVKDLVADAAAVLAALAPAMLPAWRGLANGRAPDEG